MKRFKSGNGESLEEWKELIVVREGKEDTAEQKEKRTEAFGEEERRQME